MEFGLMQNSVFFSGRKRKEKKMFPFNEFAPRAKSDLKPAKDRIESSVDFTIDLDYRPKTRKQALHM